MDINKAIELTRQELTEGRFKHTLRVMEVSETLAKRFGAPVEQAKLAAVLHDYAKNWSTERLEAYIIANDLPSDLLMYHKELWHGPVAANLFEKEWQIQEDVLDAIRYHTTGRAHMKKLEKIIYLADYIEPGRSFPGLDEVRQASEKDLNYACWLVARNSLQFLLTKAGIIYPDSFHAYNDLTRLIQAEGLLDG